MSYNLDGHFAALDAEMGQAIAVMHRSQAVKSRDPAADLIKPVLSALNFFSKQCGDTPGLDYLVGIRGATAEIRAVRPDRIAILRIEYDGASALRIGERRFGKTEEWSTERTGTADDAVQECVEFIARHIARIRPELAQDANSRPSEAAGGPLPESRTTLRGGNHTTRAAAAPCRSLGPAMTVERRRPRFR